jgi:hypothetical protein
MATKPNIIRFLRDIADDIERGDETIAVGIGVCWLGQNRKGTQYVPHAYGHAWIDPNYDTTKLAAQTLQNFTTAWAEATRNDNVIRKFRKK